MELSDTFTPCPADRLNVVGLVPAHPGRSLGGGFDMASTPSYRQLVHDHDAARRKPWIGVELDWVYTVSRGFADAFAALGRWLAHPRR